MRIVISNFRRVIERLYLLFCVDIWAFLAGVWWIQQEIAVLKLYTVWNHNYSMFAGLERHQRIDCCGCEQIPPWCCTDESELSISQRLELMVNHVACMVLSIALCWCWQCLLAVGGNLLPHTTWHVAVNRPRTFCTLQNAIQEHYKHHSDSGQQVSSFHVIALEVLSVCLLQNIVLSRQNLCPGTSLDNWFHTVALLNIGVTETCPRCPKL